MDKELPLGANDPWIRHGIGAGTRSSANVWKLDDEPKIATLPVVESPGAVKERGPIKSLGLRVPMPSYVPQGVSQAVQRPRTTMYMLGLGASQQSPKPSFVSAAQSNRNLMPVSGLDVDAQTELLKTTKDDSNVE
jgi:hypothetical protein